MVPGAAMSLCLYQDREEGFENDASLLPAEEINTSSAHVHDNRISRIDKW